MPKSGELSFFLLAFLITTACPTTSSTDAGATKSKDSGPADRSNQDTVAAADASAPDNDTADNATADNATADGATADSTSADGSRSDAATVSCGPVTSDICGNGIDEDCDGQDRPCPTLALYVDNQLGQSGNNGSSQSPVATLEQAIDLATPGTTIFVRNTGNAYQGVCVTTDQLSIIGIDGQPTIDQYATCDGRRALLYSRASDVLFENFVLDSSAFAGQSVRALIFSGLADSTIERNSGRFLDAVGPGFGQAGRSLISSSLCYDCLLEYSSSTYAEEHGIYWTNHQDNATIRNNVVAYADGACLQLNSDPETFTSGHPVKDGVMSGNLVENNILYDCGSGGGGAALNLAGVHNSIFRNNVIYGSDVVAGIANWDDGYSDWGDSGNFSFGCKNNVYYHNTIDCRQCTRHALSFRNGSTGNAFMNNIVLTGSHDAIAVDSESNTGLQIDYNLYLAGTEFEDTAENWIGLSQWQNQMGYDSHSLDVASFSTLFVPAADDYHLASGSDALNQGTDVGVTVDIEGTSRPQGSAPDLGAYESVQ